MVSFFRTSIYVYFRGPLPTQKVGEKGYQLLVDLDKLPESLACGSVSRAVAARAPHRRAACRLGPQEVQSCVQRPEMDQVATFLYQRDPFGGERWT